jgi:glycosyltransferase involved in cell wall biosynthesis
MKVSGFSFVRNAIKLGFPVVESLRSILPLCDEVVVAVGKSEDGTRDLIVAMQEPKIRIVDTVWDDSLREGGRVLAVETDKAFKAISADSDWCIYIQADELMHEEDYPAVRKAMEQWLNDKRVDGLLFKYRHFWGSYDYVASSYKWYRNEIRIVRNDPGIYSYRDAQGFRKNDNQKLAVKPIDAWIYHYGWVREPETMQQKIASNTVLYGTQPVYDAGAFDYSHVSSLEKFAGTHPSVMLDRIKAVNWTFEHDLSKNSYSFKDHFKNIMEKLTGIRPFDYKNYRII